MVSKFLFKSLIAVHIAIPLVAFSSGQVLADEKSISVINNSGQEMTGIYISYPDENEWGDNLITESVEDRGKTDFTWDSGDYKDTCVFDVRAEYEDDKSTDLYDINLCNESSLNFN